MHTPSGHQSRLYPRLFQPRLYQPLIAAFLFLSITFAVAPARPDRPADTHGLAPIRAYISAGWDTLTRSMNECGTVVDTKLAATSVMYLPADFREPASLTALQQQCKFEVKHLPTVIDHPGEVDANALNPPGLLYLENKYVVPGGRFNEMYGWDSYFIIRGLVRDGRIDLARGMVENFFFEIEHYGNVLNANRSYYLSRSQPPFLTSMILSVYDSQKDAGHEDKNWLAEAYSFAVKDHDMWTQEPHLAGSTGLSRYFDRGDGPSPESVKDETGHYRDVAAFFLRHPELEDRDLVRKDPGKTEPQTFGAQYSVRVCDSGRDASPKIAQAGERADCETAEEVALSANFYKGDRSMRESGYDISFRFGPYGAGTQNYAPVCLNSLLYKTEKDLQQMSETLGKTEEAHKWARLAEERKANIDKYLWNEKAGMFFDYNFVKQQQSTYAYVTVFYPLWAGLATTDQAKAVMKNLSIFEKPGGLVMSPYETGGQWDFPYAWAPNQLISDEGMRRYGFNAEADRVSYEFLSTVAENFRRDGTIREKYNAVTRSSETAVTAGYHINIVGFGWTNGAFLNLLHDLPKPMAERLAKEQDSAPPVAAKAGYPSVN
ncbi:MAG TPA: trehalase family glycosidase [Candidatus Acidoferrum sp.]|nr:trehalase family glycosidase [Candidatus Acidoferrum sp.]